MKFLATTGLREWWDEKSDLLMLGPWCLLENETVGKETYQVLTSPWENRKNLIEAGDYAWDLYNRYLIELTKRLNNILKVSHSEKYWRLLVGPYLLSLISMAYDRYARINCSLNENWETYVSEDGSCPFVFGSTHDFFKTVNYSCSNEFNLWLISLIIQKCWPDRTVIKKSHYPCKDIPEENNDSQKKSLIQKLKSFILNGNGQFVVVNTGHLRSWDCLWLKINMGWNRLGFRVLDDFHFENVQKQKEHREALAQSSGENDFERLLWFIISETLPTNFLENYHKCALDADKEFRKGPIKRLLSVEFWDHEKFKFIAGQLSEQNGILIEIQHGGGYGTTLKCFAEQVALEKNYFISWGWQFDVKNVYPVSLPNLIPFSMQTKREGLLFISSAIPRYTCRLDTILMPENMEDYLASQVNFFRALKFDLKNILYRPLKRDYGWGERKNISSNFPEIKLALNDAIYDLMKNSKLIVVDHPHTAFLEALSLNKPCVFYWNQNAEMIRDSAEPYFNLLRDAGILYRTPLEAADHINKIWPNVEQWWNKDEVQKARFGFCQNFVKTSPNWVKDWVNVFKKVDESLPLHNQNRNEG